MEGGVESIGIVILDRRVEQRTGGCDVAGADRFEEGLACPVAVPFGTCEGSPPAGQRLLPLGVDDRAHAGARLRIARDARERRRERLAGARHVEDHRPQEGNEGGGLAEHREGASTGERGTAVGRRRLDRIEEPPGGRGVAEQELRLGAPYRDVDRSRVHGSLEPELSALAVALGEVHVREADQRFATALAARLCHPQGAYERVAHLLERCLSRLARAS